MQPTSRTRSRGFTLFEVLAAVAVLGLVYVTLARTAMQGLRAEGEATRRLEASLIADHALSELELLLAGGVAPQVGVTESEQDQYAIFVEVAPYSLDELTTPPARPGEEQKQPLDLPLLVAGSTGQGSALLAVTVRVSWQEGVYEREVTRASFAFDQEAAAPHLAGLVEAPEDDEGDGDEELDALSELELPDPADRGRE